MTGQEMIKRTYELLKQCQGVSARDLVYEDAEDYTRVQYSSFEISFFPESPTEFVFGKWVYFPATRETPEDQDVTVLEHMLRRDPRNATRGLYPMTLVRKLLLAEAEERIDNMLEEMAAANDYEDERRMKTPDRSNLGRENEEDS